MTTGSNANATHHPLPPRDDREALSALFDGELPAESARFALKRLDHDAGWRDACGRWLLIGDALRGDAVPAAAPGFAAGVMRALAADEGMAASSVVVPVRRTPAAATTRTRWWGGAALAASVAVAAVLAVRPGMQATDADPRMASEAVPAATSTATTTPEAAAPQAPAGAVPALAVASVESAPAATPRRETRPARSSAARPARTTVAQVAAAPDEVQAAAARQPFHPPADDIVTRPWPRPVLPGGEAAALTVGLGSTAQAPRSLYPFEPRLQEDLQAATPQPAAPER